MPDVKSDDFEMQRRTLTIAGRQIELNLPANEETSLNAAVEGRCIDPYWGKLWSAAVDSAQCVLKTPWPTGARALELGCGAGLMGIAGRFAGLDVTFSDHEPLAVELATRNAQANGFDDAAGMVLEWSRPSDQKFDVLLASDVLYDKPSHSLLLQLANAMLNPSGRLCVGDPGRQLARDFLGTAAESGWKIRLYDAELQPAYSAFNNQFCWMVIER